MGKASEMIKPVMESNMNYILQYTFLLKIHLCRVQFFTEFHHLERGRERYHFHGRK
uniref:Uncharacterized protein n=1 Tax=Rhizophora mucronata TaxID=61149 RepID=A0A2P2II06_RHIMU